MSNTFRFVLALTVLAALVLSSCSNESSKAETGATESNVAQEAPARDAGGTDLAMADAAAPSADTPAAKRYAEVLAEIKVLEKQASTAETARVVLPKIEKLFQDFLSAYPEGEEAADAHFQLGMLYVSTARPNQCIDHLIKFIDMTEEQHPQKLAYSHYYLAEAYKNADKFDDAREHFNIAVNEYRPHLQPQFISMAQTSLDDMDTLKRLTIGAEPIPFEFTDLNGEKLSLEKLKGKVVLIDFWATWCAPCRVEMPNVIKLHKKYKDKGFEIVGVSLDKDKKAMLQYLDQHGMEWPQYFDGKGWGNDIAGKYKVRSIPATYLLDREGKIRYRSVRGPELEKAVEKLVKENA